MDWAKVEASLFSGLKDLCFRWRPPPPTRSWLFFRDFLSLEAEAVVASLLLLLLRGSGGKSTNNWLLKLAASRTALATPSSTLASLEAAKEVSILALEVDDVTGEVVAEVEVGVDLFLLLLRLVFFGLWPFRTFLPWKNYLTINKIHSKLNLVLPINHKTSYYSWTTDTIYVHLEFLNKHTRK